MLEILGRIRIPDDEFQFEFTRSSGPGGQNVNKVSSRVTLRWQVKASPSLPADVRERFVQRFGSRLTRDGELLLHSQRFRDRERNRADVLARLQEMILAVATAPRTRRPTRPTLGSRRRRREDKQRQAEKKQGRRSRGDLS